MLEDGGVAAGADGGLVHGDFAAVDEGYVWGELVESGGRDVGS